LLRRTRSAVVPTNLRVTRILHHPHRNRDPAIARRGDGEGARQSNRIDRARNRRRNEDANSSPRIAGSARLRADRHFEGTARTIKRAISENVSGTADPASRGGLPRAIRVAVAATPFLTQRYLFSRIDDREFRSGNRERISFPFG